MPQRRFRRGPDRPARASLSLDVIPLSGQVVNGVFGAGRITLLSIQTETAIRQFLLFREIAEAFRRICRGARVEIEGTALPSSGPTPLVRATSMAWI